MWNHVVWYPKIFFTPNTIILRLNFSQLTVVFYNRAFIYFFILNGSLRTGNDRLPAVWLNFKVTLCSSFRRMTWLVFSIYFCRMYNTAAAAVDIHARGVNRTGDNYHTYWRVLLRIPAPNIVQSPFLFLNPLLSTTIAVFTTTITFRSSTLFTA